MTTYHIIPYICTSGYQVFELYNYGVVLFKSLFSLEPEIFFLNPSFIISKRPCWNISVLLKSLHGYGISRKITQMLNTTFIPLRTSGAQKVKIYDTV